MDLRSRRLQADWMALTRALQGNQSIQVIATAGAPPQRYHIQYNIKGLEQQADGEIVVREKHLVEISLLRAYPRHAPLCRMLTPIFHPNVAPHVICLGDHWAAGESLVHVVFQIGEMIALQRYNVKSPLNGLAARWVEEHLEALPIDARPLNVV
jgi:ubiquitin-protein ligase